MLNKINNIKKNTYIMQIVTLMSGTLIAQVITLAFIPIISRLYTPAEFGIYSSFFAIVSILGLVSSLKYDQAIMLPKSDKNAQALVYVSVLITLGMVSLVTIGILLFYNFFIDYFKGQSYLVWLIPFGVLALGFLQIINAYSSRQQFYGKIATVKVANALTISGFQSLSKYIFGFNGLVLGRLFANALSFFLLLKYHLQKQTLQLSSLSKRRLLVNVKRHKNFPKYQSLTVFLNSISQNLPILLFASLYSHEVAGLYALAARVLPVPSRLIGKSVREVYYQKAAKMHANNKNIFQLYKKTTLGLIKIYTVPFLIILFLGPYLFGFIFGERWVISGNFAQILIFWTFMGFINTPSIMTYSILGIQKLQLYIEILSLFLRFISIFIGFYFFNSFWVSIILFAIVSMLSNIVIITIIYLRLKPQQEFIGDHE